MNNKPTCPICGNSADFRPAARDTHRWQCNRCGEVLITGSAEGLLRSDKNLRLEVISGWVRSQNSHGTIPKIRSGDMDRLKSLQAPPLKERLERYLAGAIALCPTLDTVFNASDPSLMGASYSANKRELAIIARYLSEQGLLRGIGGGQWRVTPEGHVAYDDLRTRRKSSSQAFVAMWFNETTKQAFDDGFEPGIREAGYEPFRIDRKEHANKIDDEIIAEIRRSAFVVADFTGHRGGVYFEAGFAMGLDMPVIWTCRKDAMNDLHFDIRQYNCIDWDEPEELAERLKNRIEALLGKGPI